MVFLVFTTVFLIIAMVFAIFSAVCAEDHGLREKDPLRGKTYPDGDQWDALPVKDRDLSNKVHGLCEKRRSHSLKIVVLTPDTMVMAEKAAVDGMRHGLYGFSHSLFGLGSDHGKALKIKTEIPNLIHQNPA